MQTLHKTLHKPYIYLIIRTLHNVGFMFQTLHKSYTRTYTNPTQKRSKTIHKRNANPTRKPTQTQRKTLHKSVQKLYTKPFTEHSSTIHTPNILVLNTKFRGNIHEPSWREKVEEFRRKNQQFWAFFRRFNINIFNLREHFSPPNFAYSARSFT